jgi:hypothetical protein
MIQPQRRIYDTMPFQTYSSAWKLFSLSRGMKKSQVSEVLTLSLLNKSRRS